MLGSIRSDLAKTRAIASAQGPPPPGITELGDDVWHHGQLPNAGWSSWARGVNLADCSVARDSPTSKASLPMMMAGLCRFQSGTQPKHACKVCRRGNVGALSERHRRHSHHS